MIENNIETGMVIAFGIVFLMGFTWFIFWMHIDMKVNSLERDLKKHMREKYERK